MTLSPPSPTSLRFCTIGSFVEHVAGLKDDIDERIWDPEVKVHETGSLNLAAVWAPFRAKINGEWKVTGLADSCRLPTEEEMLLE